MTEDVSQRDPVERLAEEFMARLRRGEHPPLSEYTAAHPEVADEIRDLFPALVLMEEARPAGTLPHLPTADPEITPERLGDYRILREVARGGMGVVYEAEQVALGRHVALKVLPAQADGSSLRLLRFRREARSAARLHHTNIVPVFDVGSAGGVHYYAMQFIRGQGLDEVLRELHRLRAGVPPADGPAADLTASLADGLRTGAFPAAPIVPVPKPADPRSEPSAILAGPAGHYLRSVARLGVQAADALAYAHGQRVLHRDVKPSNLLLDRQGTLWLTDFGLAKDDTEDLTRTGDIVGTIRYMAPERFQGVSDPRTDVYSLGVTLYEMLTLRPAFPEQDRVRLVGQIAKAEPPTPRSVDPTLPRDLETVVLKAIEKEPGRRYQSAADMAEDLRRFLADRPIKARRASWREQAWRWCRRNPGVAASLAVAFALLALLATGLSVGTVLVWRAKKDAETARGEAEASLAEEKVSAYFQRIALADREFAAGRVARGEQQLAQCPQELRRWEWHYLDRSRGRAAAGLSHPHPITGMAAVSPDGRWLATAGRNGVVTVWNLGTHTSHEFKAHPTAWTLAFSPDSRVLVTASDAPEGGGAGRGELRFSDPATGEKVQANCDLGDRYATALAFSPDGRRLAVASWRAGEALDRIDVRDAASGKVTLEIGPHPAVGQALEFSPDGSLLAAAGSEEIVAVFAADTGRVVHGDRNRRPGRHSYWRVAFSPDGRRLAAGYGDENEKEPGGVRLWEVGSWRELPRIHGPDAHGLGWGPDGRLATGEYDGSVRVWDAERGVELLTLRGHTDVVRTVAFTPDGYRLVSVGDDRLAVVWDATPIGDGELPGDKHVTLTGHAKGVKVVAFDPAAPVLVAGGMDGQLLAWDTRDWAARPRALVSGGKAVHAAAYSPGGRWLAVGGESAGECMILAARDGVPQVPLQLDGGFWPLRLSVSPDSLFVAGYSRDGEVVVWDSTTGKARRLVKTVPWGYGVAFHPDVGKSLLAVVSTGEGVRVYDPATGRLEATLPHAGGTGLAFSPDGTRLASVGWDNVIRVWRTDGRPDGWKQVDQYRDPGGGPNAVAFSPDGKLLAWGGVDATVKVWKVGTDTVRTLRGHRNWVWDVAFSPKDDVIASAGRDGTAKIWPNPFFKK